ncbi:MAG: T9SS type A sorting domain-containing protein [Bacteroidota bacterium]
MKKFLVVFLLVISAQLGFSQNGFENLIVEHVNANIALNGAIAYRVYVDMAEDYQLQAVYGNNNHDLIIETDETWYNNQFGSATGENIGEALIDIFPNLAFDSYVTAGASSNLTLVVQTDDDDDGTPNGRIASSLPDALIPSTDTGADVADEISSSFGVGSATSDNILIGGPIGGAWASTDNNTGITASNTVLIGQFTTAGNLYFELNIQLRNTVTGQVERYVARDATAGEIEESSLIYNTLACEAYNYEDAPIELSVEQNLNTNKTTLKWRHYNDEASGCIIRGAISDGITNIGGFGNVLIQGALIDGDSNNQDKSASLSPDAQYNLFNPATFPTSTTNNLVPGAQYMWQVRCGCIIDVTLPLPDRLGASNVHLSPYSEFNFFTNLENPEGELNEQNEFKNFGDVFSLYPNPFDESFILESTLEEGITQIEIVNVIGEVVMSNSMNTNDGLNRIEIDGSNLEAGIYILTVKTQTTASSTKIIKR